MRLWIAFLGLVFATSPSLLGQCRQYETIKLQSPPGALWFGAATDVQGDVLLVSALGNGAGSGVVYVYRDLGTQWQVEHVIAPVTALSTVYWFGRSCRIDGDVIVVGVPYDRAYVVDGGAAYVFRFDGTQWNEEQRFELPNPMFLDEFGTSVDVSGDVLVVGAWGREHGGLTDPGLVNVYRFDGVSWVEEQQLTASDAADGARFGDAVSVDGDVIAVGANGAEKAYVFRRSGGLWVEEQIFTGPKFGDDVDVCGNVLGVAGAVGSALYEHDGLTWNEVAANLPFSLNVRVAAGEAVGGSQLTNETFRRTTAGWIRINELSTSDNPTILSWAGNLGSDGATVAAGAPAEASVHLYRWENLGLDPIPWANPIPVQTCGGLPGQRTMLAAVAFNGLPILYRVGQGLYDVDGEASYSVPYSPTLRGNTVTFLSIGYLEAGEVTVSSPATLTLR